MQEGRANRFALAVVLTLAACKLLVHLYAGRHYGYFVDELYYLACSRHLDWGYVDQPPLIAGITWIVRSLLGDSLPALRFLPAIAGAGTVALTGLIARELGGNWFAQGVAALAVLIAPGFLALGNLLTMNAFEPVFWLACAWLLLRILKTGDQKLWIWFGVLAGLGLENKYSMAMFGAGLIVGLVLSPQRRALASPWIWIGGLIAFLLFLPNLLWNIQHHFPFLELQANIRRSGRDVPLGPVAFFGQEVLTMHPLNVPIWMAGLWFYFFSKAGKPYRPLGWAWVFTAVVVVALSPRVYYLYPAFPVLFAGGAVAWEGWLQRPQLAWWKFALPALMAVTGAILAPLAIPVLPPETYVRYTEALHLAPPAIETHRLGPLPQLFADQFGWEEMAATVARVYNSLPPEVRRTTAIFGQNYGQAGAIDLFGPRYGLPPAISGHQSYFLWGPRGYTGESVIVMAGRQQRLESQFASVEKAASVDHPYSMPYEHFDVFYCRGLKQPLSKFWPQVKSWD
ncbi:MAG TPA: glycosyltransferase family 39 protein [Bryobacteraceae bacterium]|jgi:4-amino-4-deoxy-L-arabinose transferase-like glycosyltransferase|nr:glycosyltransferase family 39 protein [Bryobacteraceae bacterium]